MNLGIVYKRFVSAGQSFSFQIINLLYLFFSLRMSGQQQTNISYPPTAADFCYRKVMKQSVAAICKMSGFDFIQPRTLELLTQMMTCCKFWKNIRCRIVYNKVIVLF